MEADFSGWATKSGVKCSDGRTINRDAFKHQDKMKVPLVWQHNSNSPEFVLGHALLESRADGMYAYGYFNDTDMGETAKKLVKHGDIDALSIFARRLQEQGSLVMHGDITEVSIVMNGANKEAKIDNIALAHGDGSYDISSDEAVIYFGEELQHENPEGEIVGNIKTKTVAELAAEAELEHADTDNETVGDILDTLTEKQADVVKYVINDAVEEAVAEAKKEPAMAHGESFADDEAFLAHVDSTIETHIKEGITSMRNTFEQNGQTAAHADRPKLTREQFQTIFKDGDRLGSLKESFLVHADEYGIDDINVLFPDAQLDSNGITYVSRRMEWVQNVLDGTHHSPIARIKSISADITADEARAKGYVKGNYKKDEVIKMLKRVTIPTTIYKKQKLDRDDIVDITEVNILVWIQAEMRVMLDEEIAIAILVGDNREADDDDKIDEDSVRPIAYDIDMYNTSIDIDPAGAVNDLIDLVVQGLDNFKGSGTPTFYTTRKQLTRMLLVKDSVGRRLYATRQELAAALTVKDVIDVEAMERNQDIFGIAVNLADYTIGADKGGEINLFDFFDIDYNQQKYLLETRISGALTRPKSAVTFKVAATSVVTPLDVTFVNGTGIATVPAVTGITYKNKETGATLSTGAQTAITVGDTLEVIAVANTGYALAHDADRDWAFTRTA